MTKMYAETRSTHLASTGLDAGDPKRVWELVSSVQGNLALDFGVSSIRGSVECKGVAYKMAIPLDNAV